MPLGIPISGLIGFSQIETGDFVALVESSSMTTYRTSIQGLFAFMATTASCRSSSFSVTASYAISSGFSNTSNTASQAISASYAYGASVASTASSSISSSYAASASVASMSFFAVTASTSVRSPQSDTASYLRYQGFNNGTASFSISASWAQQAATSSYVMASVGSVPIGTIVDYAASTISDPNWMICDGSPISRTTYSSLFSIIGSTWGGGDGATTFNLPDLRKRLTMGARFGITNPMNSDVVQMGYSMLSGSVGQKGGGEAYQYHYHFGNLGYVKDGNDDYELGLLGYGDLQPTYQLYPSRGSDTTVRTFPQYGIVGSSTGRSQPNSYAGYSDIYNGPHLDTSFPINDIPYQTWFTSSAYPNDWLRSQGYYANKIGRQDLSMPYAVTNKIIRVL